MSPNIKITDAAKEQLKKIELQQTCLGLRLSVKKTGCSGYAYALEPVHHLQQTDTLYPIPAVTFYIDNTWVDWFDGLTIDLIEDQSFGLKQKKLAFINPKEAARCGCGKSFQMKEAEQHVS